MFPLTRPSVAHSLYSSKKRMSLGITHAVNLKHFNTPHEPASTNLHSVPYLWVRCPFGICVEYCIRPFAQEGTLSDGLCVSPCQPVTSICFPICLFLPSSSSSGRGTHSSTASQTKWARHSVSHNKDGMLPTKILPTLRPAQGRVCGYLRQTTLSMHRPTARQGVDLLLRELEQLKLISLFDPHVFINFAVQKRKTTRSWKREHN